MKFLYFVGKPYISKTLLTVARKNNYKLGVFHDSSLPLPASEQIERIIPLDFSSPETLLSGLSDADLQVDGLLCTYENYIVAKAILAQHFGAAGPTLTSAEASTDKYLMRQAFMAYDPTISPQFRLIHSRDELPTLVESMRYPLIIKPTNLVKSLLVLRCNNQEELLSNFTYAQERVGELYRQYNIHGRQPQLIVEEFITGKTCSIAAFVDANGVPHFCDGVVELTNAQDKNIDDNYIYSRRLPGDFSPELQADLFAVARKGIAALGMRSVPAHVELIYNDTDVKLIEIGARIGGYRPRMYDLSYGINLSEQEVRLALGEEPVLHGTFQKYSAVYELFPTTEGAFEAIDGLGDTSKYHYFSLKAEPGTIAGPAKHGYKACAVIIVSSEDEATFHELCDSVDKLKVRLA